MGLQSLPPDQPNGRLEPLAAGDMPPPASNQLPPRSPAIPTIGSEPPDGIIVGAGGKLTVPREDIDADVDHGEEIDLGLGTIPIRRPGRREWVTLSLASELPTRLLQIKRTDFETEYYHVEQTVRGPLREELKDVRVFLYFSHSTRAFALWIINYTPGNSWYESIAQLLRKPPEFFVENAVRISSDRNNARYHVRYKAAPNQVVWPTKETGELLAEALGPTHLILSADHAVYRELIDGRELD